MTTPDIKAVLVLTNAVQVALWRAEITGQLSDGMWENSRPYDHWKFWTSNVRAEIGPEPCLKLLSYARPIKDKYNLTGLIEHIGDRMLALARMSKALQKLGVESSYDLELASDDMPPTFEEFCRLSETGAWPYPHIVKRMTSVTQDIAKEFYAQKYTLRELRTDLRTIKLAMKTPIRTLTP